MAHDIVGTALTIACCQPHRCSKDLGLGPVRIRTRRSKKASKQVTGPNVVPSSADSENKFTLQTMTDNPNEQE